MDRLRLRPEELRGRGQGWAVLTALEPLLPEGLPRGSLVTVDAAAGVAGATSLALALAARPSQTGAWLAAVVVGENPKRNCDDGGPGRAVSVAISTGTGLGWVAAAELGVRLDRLVVVTPLAGSNGATDWPSVLAGLLDGFELVLVDAGGRARLRPRDTRRLTARLRERGGVMVAVGGDLPGEGPRVRLTVTAGAWEGIEGGAGHLQRRRVTVEASGRGSAARPRRTELWLPAPDGEAAPTRPVPATSSLGDGEEHGLRAVG